MAYSDGELARLHRAALDGDSAALERLLSLLFVPLRRYVLRRSQFARDPEELASDLAQTALIRITQSFRSCRATTDRQVMGWAIAIVRNLLLDDVRARQSSTTGPDLPLDDRTPVTQIEPGQIHSPALRLLRRVFREVWHQVPRDTRRLVRLRVERELSWPEVAVMCGTTPAAAKRRFQRAQASLRRQIRARAQQMSPFDRDALSRFWR